MGKPPPPRQRYNAKARGSVASGLSSHKRKHKRIEELSEKGIGKLSGSEHYNYTPLVEEGEDSNVEMILPRSAAEESEQEKRKSALKAELISSSENKMTSKKKKKLDQYIAKKLKKEDRLVLFQKLQSTQSQINPSLLHSSSTLGTARVRTNERRAEEEEDMGVRKVMSGNGAGVGKSRKRMRLGLARRLDVEEEDSDSGISHSEDDPAVLKNGHQSPEPVSQFLSSLRPSTGKVSNNPFTMSSSHFTMAVSDSSAEQPLAHILSRFTASPSDLIASRPLPASSSDPASSVTPHPKIPSATSTLPDRTKASMVTVGAGLKRSADGTIVTPKIVHRQAKPTKEVRLRVPIVRE